MRTQTFRKPAILLIALHLNACSSWRPGTAPVGELLRTDPPDIVRVTTTDGETRVLDHPVVVGDQLSSEAVLRVCPPDDPIHPCPVTHVDGISVAPLALDEITLVEVRTFSPLKTVGGLAATAAAGFALLYVLIAVGGDSIFGSQ